ncbi:sodium-dependent proline transporter-like [Tachypleus tridentatus]|uniref:sodium-dependent proline transporter-like n=1 Tax=Tachypleus tridentatus TaxID=6853 RepID=UPI003FD146D5
MELSLCLLLAWFLVYLVILKGLQSSCKVWVTAGTQVFFIFGIGFGSVVTLGSYNKFSHNFFRRIYSVYC